MGTPPSDVNGAGAVSDRSADGARDVGLPQVCEFGATNLKISGSCLDGEHIQLFEGADLGHVASECCTACEPPECTGWKLLRQAHQRSTPTDTNPDARAMIRYSCATLRGNLTRYIPTAGASCLGSAQRDALPGGSWNWGTTHVSGGSWFSTPNLGQCLGTRRPGDGTGCTWRIRARPTFIESTCVNERLDQAILKATPDCFKDKRCHDNGDVAAGVNTSSECFFRCYWLALNSDSASADALWRNVIRPTFLRAWPGGGDAKSQCPIVPM